MADLVITITIPDARRAEFLDFYATRYGWVDQATSGAKPAFVRQAIRDIVRAPYRQWRQDQQAEAALAALPVLPDDGVVTT